MQTSQKDVPSWLVRARKEIGVAEIPGPKASPAILGYARDAKLVFKYNSDETPWCAIFVNAILERCNIPGNRSAWARDFLKYGDVVRTPEVGDIVVFDRGNGYGHVAFFIRRSPDESKVLVLGGNQADSVCEQWYSADLILGIRRPRVPEKAWGEVTIIEKPEPANDPVPVFMRHEQDHVMQSHLDAEEHLRLSGSRTITSADKSEGKAKAVAATGAIGIVYWVIQTFSDVYQMLAPLLPVIGPAIAGLTLLLGAYIIIDQRRIKHARADDAITGKNASRITPLGGPWPGPSDASR